MSRRQQPIQESPYNNRISKITEKLSTISIGIENERYQKLDQAEQRIQQAEDLFNEFSEQIFTKLNGLKDQLGKLAKQVDEEKLVKEQAADLKDKEVAALDNRFQTAISNEESQRREGETKVLRMTEDKGALLRTEVQKETRTRVEAIEAIHQGLQNDLPKIQDAIRGESQERDEADQNVMKSITDELVKLSNMIAGEKKSRDESEQGIFEMLKDVVQRVKVELDQEKKSRETQESYLVSLLEDTCNKLSVAANL